MERLTKNINGVICYVGEHKQNDEDVPAEMTTGAVRDVLTSLFAYEEALEKGKIARIPENTPDIDFMRIFELIIADAEKRVVVLPPAKIGDALFYILNGKIYEGTLYRIAYENHQGKIHTDISADRGYNAYGARFEDFGKTVFLTREAAEEALQKTT